MGRTVISKPRGPDATPDLLKKLAMLDAVDRESHLGKSEYATLLGIGYRHDSVYFSGFATYYAVNQIGQFYRVNATGDLLWHPKDVAALCGMQWDD